MYRSSEERLTNSYLREPKDRLKTPKPTARQREIIQLLAEGLSIKEVGNILNICCS